MPATGFSLPQNVQKKFQLCRLACSKWSVFRNVRMPSLSPPPKKKSAYQTSSPCCKIALVDSCLWHEVRCTFGGLGKTDKSLTSGRNSVTVVGRFSSSIGRRTGRPARHCSPVLRIPAFRTAARRSSTDSSSRSRARWWDEAPAPAAATARRRLRHPPVIPSTRRYQTRWRVLTKGHLPKTDMFRLTHRVKLSKGRWDELNLIFRFFGSRITLHYIT